MGAFIISSTVYFVPVYNFNFSSHPHSHTEEKQQQQWKCNDKDRTRMSWVRLLKLWETP